MADDPVLTIRRRFARPAPELLEAFREAGTGPIADALGRRGAMDCRMKPITRAARFCGAALTVWTPPRDNLAPYAALKYAEPGDVLVMASGDGEASLVGDVFVGMARNGGVAALVVDGLVRDAEGLDAVGIPVFARGLSPNAPFKHGPGEIGLEVTLGGVVVRAGDIVVGDRDGVVVVPLASAGIAQESLQTVLAKERRMEVAVRDGAKLPEWLDAVFADRQIRYVD